MMFSNKKNSIKIYSVDKVIYLIDNQDVFNVREGVVLESVQTAEEMKAKYNKLMNKNNVKEIYFFNTKLTLLLDYFSSLFRIIEAAGGLVKNEKGEWLFIFRNGKWDLPKGKIEKGEAVKTAAIREVEEECGIGGLSILKELPSTYHTYFLEEKNILKRTYWFEMLCTDTSQLVPQTEEGITEVKWIASAHLKPVYDKTYDSIKEVLKEI
jgi:ADP-ribose pyrophosphatase YjhB (NUDIX family)